MQPSGFVCSYDNQVNVWTTQTPLNGPSAWTQTTVGHDLTGATSPPTRPTPPARSGSASATPTGRSTRAAGSTTPASTSPTTPCSPPTTAAGASPSATTTATAATAPGWPAASAARCSSPPTQSSMQTACSAVGTRSSEGVISSRAAASRDPAVPGRRGRHIRTRPARLGPGIVDYGNSNTPRGGTYSAAGKLFYDHNNTPDGRLPRRARRPRLLQQRQDGRRAGGVGISILPNADAAFATGSMVTQFPQQYEVPGTNTGCSRTGRRSGSTPTTRLPGLGHQRRRQRTATR